MLRVQSTVRPEYYQDYLMQIAASKIITRICRNLTVTFVKFQHCYEINIKSFDLFRDIPVLLLLLLRLPSAWCHAQTDSV